MIRICLSVGEQGHLRPLFRTIDAHTLRYRLPIVLMAARLRAHQDIAIDLGITSRTFRRWLNAYLKRGMDGLHACQAKGVVPKLTPDLTPRLQQWGIVGLAKQGLDRDN